MNIENKKLINIEWWTIPLIISFAVLGGILIMYYTSDFMLEPTLEYEYDRIVWSGDLWMGHDDDIDIRVYSVEKVIIRNGTK